MPELSWPLAGHLALRDQLLRAYSADRGYHDVQHLAEVLGRIEELGEGSNREVVLAAWYHDAIYEGSPDDEELSAQLAERDLIGTGVDVAEVARLVRLTSTHQPAADDHLGEILCDADLAILAADPERYLEYSTGVRRDYASVPDADFRSGRRAVLEELLGRDHLFRTRHARLEWDQRARENLESEIADLA